MPAFLDSGLNGIKINKSMSDRNGLVRGGKKENPQRRGQINSNILKGSSLLTVKQKDLFKSQPPPHSFA